MCSSTRPPAPDRGTPPPHRPEESPGRPKLADCCSSTIRPVILSRRPSWKRPARPFPARSAWRPTSWSLSCSLRETSILQGPDRDVQEAEFPTSRNQVHHFHDFALVFSQLDPFAHHRFLVLVDEGPGVPPTGHHIADLEDRSHGSPFQRPIRF